MRSFHYKHYLLLVLTVILAFNLLDRVALGIILQDVKADLGLSDTQLGLLSGIAFTLFYSIMGIPIARWADRGNRVTIIAVTALLWSVTVALCGMAASFAQLLAIRVLVAVGEAGCVPPAMSLLADYFSRHERPRATAIYGVGAPIAGMLGFFLAGWFNELYGWRMTFMLLGAPGVALAALAWFTLEEPRRGRTRGRVYAAGADDIAHAQLHPSLREVFVTLWAYVTFRHLLLCIAVFFFFGYGIVQWLPAFFIRSYGLSTGEIGTWLAVSMGLGGVAGTYLAGAFASRHAVHNESLQLKAIAIAIGCAGVLAAFVYLTSNPYWAFVLIGFYTLGIQTINGPVLAAIQTLVPERMRAVSFALIYLVANLLGMGLGPLTTGVLSDALNSWLGQESLRYALLILAPGYLWCAAHAWFASRSVAGDLMRSPAASLGADKPDATRGAAAVGGFAARAEIGKVQSVSKAV
ncbi:MAG TPA: MFS transporter, partial [Steroidobacteraceae bacterium]|nr:MFS transporter [Steroidobacteraceae bacterium]